MKKNTRIYYMYRDGSNYKFHGEAVLKGVMPQVAINNIRDSLEEGEFFIPSQVGLEDKQPFLTGQFKYEDEDDHSWHELGEFEPTNDKPTVEMTTVEFYKKITSTDFIEIDFSEYQT